MIKGRDDRDSEVLSLRSPLDCRIFATPRILETCGSGWDRHPHDICDLYHGLLAPGSRR